MSSSFIPDTKGLVSATKVQALTTEQKEVARTNIAAQLASTNLDRLDGNAAAQRTALSINNVDNTSDANKPISTATQAALNQIANPWAGVAYTAIGTSITQQPGSYVDTLNTLLGSTGQNLGISGGSATPSGTGGIDIQAFAVSPTSQLVIIDALINDFFNNAPIGTLSDTGNTTLHGALYNLVTTILSANPRRQVVLCTSYMFIYGSGDWDSPNGNGATLVQWNNAIRDAAKRLGVNCCDIDLLSGMAAPLISTFTTDGLHINNPTGSARYAQTLFNYLRNIPRGPTPVVTTGWNLRTATASDLLGIGLTIGSVNGSGDLTHTITSGGYAAVCAVPGFNAIQFDHSNNLAGSFLVVARGASGFSAVGGYGYGQMAFAFNFLNNGSAGSNQAFLSNDVNQSRIRIANVNGVFRVEAWNGSSWINGGGPWDVNDYAVFSSGFRETLCAGFVAFGAGIFTNIKVGTYS